MLSRKDKQILIHWAQYGIRFYIWIQTLILIIWSFFSIVPGVGDALKETEAGTFHAVSHLGFWMAFEIFLVSVGGTVISMNANTKTLRNASLLYLISLLLGIAGNGIHLAAGIVELVRCTSVVCMGYPAVLLLLCILFGSLVLLEFGIVYLTVKLREYLEIKVKK